MLRVSESSHTPGLHSPNTPAGIENGMIPKDLQNYSSYFSEYTELRAQENRQVGISMINGDVMRNQKTTNRGISSRVFKNGMWGFASDPQIEDGCIRQVIDTATHNACFLHEREKKASVGLPKRPANEAHDMSSNTFHVSQRDYIDFLKIIDNYLGRHYEKLLSRTLVLNLLKMEKSLITSDGSSSYSLTPRAILSVEMTLEKDGQPIELFDVYGGFGQFEENFSDIVGLFAGLDQQYTHLVRKAGGVYPEAGIADCILDANLAGILAHEAVGHTAEADFVRGGSVAGEMLKQQVASPLVNMVDFAHTARGKRCPVPVYVDDEGTKAEDAVLIQDGILQGFMHNKESADYFKSEPTGNARAFAFSDEPLIRMRNTAILPGSNKLADMIASIEHGFYLMRSSNGQADSTGEFMFGVVQGYEIVHGRLGRALRDTTISGVAFDMLKSVSMISDEISWNCAGMCGKKQLIPVGMGGPALKCRVNIGGK